MIYEKSAIIFEPHLSDHRFKNLTNKTFGHLTVLGYAGKREDLSRWFCECKCRKITAVTTAKLMSGHTKSCGCLKHESHSVTHGESAGGKQTPEYAAFAEAKRRCQSISTKSFTDYGGRGIEFRFESFEQFLADIGRRPSVLHSLDRQDVNGHYEPGNVRWATKTTQARNTRTNRIITIDGISKCLAAWAEDTGNRRIRLRLWRGWCERCAIFSTSCPHKITSKT